MQEKDALYFQILKISERDSLGTVEAVSPKLCATWWQPFCFVSCFS